MTFVGWFLCVWLFPYLLLLLVLSLVEGEFQRLNPLNWDSDARMICTMWTILVWIVSEFILLCLMVPK